MMSRYCPSLPHLLLGTRGVSLERARGICYTTLIVFPMAYLFSRTDFARQKQRCVVSEPHNQNPSGITLAQVWVPWPEGAGGTW